MSNTQIRGANNGTGTSQIKAGSLSNADIHASAAIALSKLAEAVIQADGGQAFTADQPMGGFKLTNLGTPTVSTDAVTKAYADSLASGLDYKEAVQVATTASQGTYTIMSNTVGASNGVVLNVTGGSGTFDPDAGETIVTSGGTATIVAVDNTTAGSTTKIWVRNITGSALTTSFTSHSGGVTGLTISSIDTTAYVAFLTTNAVGVANIDATAVAVTHRVLVKNQATTSQNGTYTVILAGTASLTQVLARATDMDGTPTNEISTGNAVFVIAGATLATTGWVLSTTDAVDPNNIAVHTETKVFAQFNAASSYTASNGITLVANDFQLNLTGLSTATIVSADEIAFADASDTNIEKKTTFANFEAALTLDNQLGTLSVGKGGTGATTFTANGVLYGNTTSAVQVTAASGTAGAILHTAASGGAPSWTTSISYDNTTKILSFANASSIAATGTFGIRSSGIMTVASTDQTAASTNSAAANFESGAVSGTTSNSGVATLRSGASSTSGNTGNVFVYSGDALSGNTGSTSVTTGNATTGNSGAMTLYTGGGSTLSGQIDIGTGGAAGTGIINLDTGNATGGNSGAINISTGTATGTAGNIIFKIATAEEARVKATGFNLVTGNTYQINDVDVLSATTLGSAVVTSSLTSVGTLTSGTWNATVIGTLYGGTGLAITPTTIADGEILIGSNAGDAFVKSTITGTAGEITVTNGAGTITLSLATAVITSSNIITGETPTGTVNGANDTFTLANTPIAGTVKVYLNGMRQKSGAGNDYTISGSTITFEAGNIPQTGDVILTDYFT